MMLGWYCAIDVGQLERNMMGEQKQSKHGTGGRMMEKIDYKKGRNMTAMELVARDEKRAKINYLRAKERNGATAEEIAYHEELWKLRKEIVKVVGNDRAL